MKILTPTPLLAEAADVLTSVREDVVIVGAAALEAALADVASVAITPTRDVDVVVPIESVEAVVAVLEDAGLQRSDLPHEQGFTWVRADLKVQLVRSYHPFPGPLASRLPANTVFAMAAEPAHQVVIGFPDDRARPRLTCANAACLLALKEAAFGRTRSPDDTPVERDFHDAYLLISAVPDAVVRELGQAQYEVRQRVSRAISLLAAGAEETASAARQMVRLRIADSQRLAEADVRRAAVQMQRRMART